MTDDADIEIEYETSPALKMLLGREPVLDRQQKLIGHELVFRSHNHDAARRQSDTTKILEQAAETGMENLAGTGLGFVSATTEFLESESVLFLPQKNFIIILPSTLSLTETLIARVAELRRMGFKFAVDQAQLTDPARAGLLALAEIVRIELPTPPQVLLLNHEQIRQYRTGQKRLFAQHVQEAAQFEHCMQLGFDYFSGNFYTKPVLLENKKFSASEISIMKALELLGQDADDNQIEQAIKHDGVISVNILKHVNSAAAAPRQRIGSLKQAIQIIGRAQLTRWLQVMLYEKPDSQPAGVALFTLAISRAKLLELLAKRQLPSSKVAPDVGFIVGLMSLMDALFGMPMQEVLQKITVYNEVNLALLERKGVYGQLLHLVEYLEQLTAPEPPPELLPLLAQLQLPPEELFALQQQAFVWVNQL
jgi:EAL and modified HD-GYP domain-containing signal transduction protein